MRLRMHVNIWVFVSKHFFREGIGKLDGSNRALSLSALGNDYTPVCDILDERAFVNGIDPG